MAEYLTNDQSLTSVANAIRTKGGTSAQLVYPEGFVSAINNISTGTDVSDTTATAADVLSGKYFYNASGTKTQGSIASKTSSDLTSNGATVTVPAGHYASAASKSIASGSATTPATTITTAPSISVNASGLITATNSKTQSVTPSVSAGYVSTGTAGTITVNGSNTSQLATQGAQTITPGTTDQTIQSGKYLTGTQTIKGDANLVAANIAKNTTIFGVTGTHAGGATITDTTDSHGGTIRNIDTENATTIEPLSVTTNGTYTATSGKAYSPVTVNVSEGGGGITLKRIAGNGTSGVQINGWGAKDFITTQELNENPPRIIFGTIKANNVIYGLFPKQRNYVSGSNSAFFYSVDLQNVTRTAMFDLTMGSYLNRKSIRLESFEGVNISNCEWELYSNAPSVQQFTFDVELDGSLVDTYTADEGMTWEGWLDSDYNVDRIYQMDGENVIYDMGGEYFYLCDSNGDPVVVTDEIVQGTVYQLMHA